MNAPILISQPGEHEYLTDKLVDAVRSHEMSRLASLSPAAGCLAPLLMSLGLEERAAEIIEALPVEQDEFVLADLRNVLFNLGLHTEPRAFDVRLFSDVLLPCILEDSRGGLHVVTSNSAAGFMRYVAEADQYAVGELPPDIVKAYYLTDTRLDNDPSLNEFSTSWLTRLVSRFRPLMALVVLMSGVINLLTLGTPLFILAVYDGVIGAQYQRALPYLVFGIIAVLLAEGGLRWLRALAIGRLASRVDYLVSTESFRHLLRLPPLSVERSDLGTRLRHLKQFDGVRDFLAGPNMILAMELPFAPVYVIVIAIFGGPLFWIPAGMLLLYLITGVLVSRSSRVTYDKSQQQRGRRNTLLFEVLSGLSDLKQHRDQRAWMARVREADGEAMSAKMHDASQQAWLRNFGNLLTGIGSVLMLWAGATLVIAGEIGVGALIASMVIMWRLGGLSQSLLQLAPRLRPLIGSVKHINAVMALPAEKRSPSANQFLEGAQGRVEFDRVHFRYDAESNPALYSCTFSVEPGDVIALTGLSGAGKSTIIKLIAGLYRPQSGSIYFDGVDLRQFDPPGLRRMLAYLPHEKTLLRGTVADNIRLSSPEATDADVVRAASDANVLNLIRSLPAGFNTPVHGATHLSSSLVSGICLARAFLRECPLLLLDEPGENFDDESDRLLVKQLEARKERQTIIMATHRPSQIALANRVIVLDNGQLITT